MTENKAAVNNDGVHTYTGLLTQDEFRLRYAFITVRINSGYTAEELSFLIGKPGFYLSDYEEMNNGVKLTLGDLELLSLILTNPYTEVLSLDRDELGATEKRIIRCRREEIFGAYHYTFKHPWTVKGKKSEIYIKEPIFSLEESVALLIGEEVIQAIYALLKAGYFIGKKRTALDIFRQVKPSQKYSPFFKPCHLMQVIYKLIQEGGLVTGEMRNQIYYKDGVISYKDG